MIVNVASNPLLTRLSNAATFAVKPQSRKILTCMIDQVSQAAAKMVLFFNVPSGDNAKRKMFQVTGFKLQVTMQGLPIHDLC